MTRHNIEAQGEHVVKGFYDPDNGDLRVQLGLPAKMEGSVNCAFGMDGSGSMQNHYRHSGWGPTKKPSEVEGFLHEAAAFVADLDSDKGVQVYVWATGGDGRQVVDLGNFPKDGLEKLSIKTNVDSTDRDAVHLGGATFLAPALEQMVKEIVVDSGAGYGLIVAMTDGKINDMSAVKQWATQKAQQIAAKQHPPFKITLVGFDDADPAEMEELDNLDTGTPIDIFNALSAADLHGAMEHLNAETLTSDFTVAEGGYLEANGKKWQFEGGVPQRIDTTIDPKLSEVTLVIVEGGNEVDRLPIRLPVGAAV